MERLEMNRRMITDRRQMPTKPISRHIFFGRRQSIRRLTDRKIHPYVDRYGHGLLVTLLLIMLLCVLDAYFTFIHMEGGGLEINPLMNLLMGYGYLWCFVVKYILTALAVFIFCVCKNFFLVRVFILCILFFYLVLLCYHLFLLFSM